MQQTFAALLLGLTTFASAAAHAEIRVDAAGFAMSVPGFQSSNNGLSLLSDDAGTTRIAVKGFNVASPLWSVTSGNWSVPVDAMNWDYAYFDFDVREGYRITSMTLTATLTGVLDPAAPANGTAGAASNQYSIGWGVSQGDQSISMGQQTVSDLNGDRQIQLNASLPFEGDFAMNLDSEVLVSAQSGVSYWHDGDDAEGFNYEESHASLHWHDAVLTVQVSPVPEPSTWGMLLAGAALLGVAARRRAH